MEQEGGVYKVPCVVNGAKMKFIFDTGAATVCLSESMAEYLLDNDYISKNDFIGVGTSIVADGSIVKHLTVILRDIEIGGLHLKDVEASVIEGQKAPLLLGQTAIQKLGQVSIEGNRLCIKRGKTTQSDSQAQEALKNALALYEIKNFEGVIEILSELDKNNREYCQKHIWDYDFIYNYAMSLLLMSRDVECVNVLKSYQNFELPYKIGNKEYIAYGWDMWDNFMQQERLTEKEEISPEDEYMYQTLLSLYSIYASSLKGLERYREAIVYYNKADIMFNSKLLKYPKGEDMIIRQRDRLASCYLNVNDLYTAKEYCEKNIQERCAYLGVTKSDIQSNRVKDEILGICYSTFAYVMYRFIKEKEYDVEKANTTYDKCMIMSAKCGYEGSIEYCQKHNLPYFSNSSSLY